MTISHIYDLPRCLITRDGSLRARKVDCYLIYDYMSYGVYARPIVVKIGRESETSFLFKR